MVILQAYSFTYLQEKITLLTITEDHNTQDFSDLLV